MYKFCTKNVSSALQGVEPSKLHACAFYKMVNG